MTGRFRQRRLGKRDSQQSVAQGCLGLVHVDIDLQRDPPLEAAVIALAVAIVALLFVPLFLALAAQDQGLVGELDVDVLLLQARNLRGEHELLLVLDQVDHRPAEVGLASTHQGQVESVPHVVEQAIDFALQREERIPVGAANQTVAIAVPGNELRHTHRLSPPQQNVSRTALAVPPAMTNRTRQKFRVRRAPERRFIFRSSRRARRLPRLRAVPQRGGKASRAKVARSMLVPHTITPTRRLSSRSRSGPHRAAVAAAPAGSTASFMSANSRPIARCMASSGMVTISSTKRRAMPKL